MTYVSPNTVASSELSIKAPHFLLNITTNYGIKINRISVFKKIDVHITEIRKIEKNISKPICNCQEHSWCLNAKAFAASFSDIVTQYTREFIIDNCLKVLPKKEFNTQVTEQQQERSSSNSRETVKHCHSIYKPS